MSIVDDTKKFEARLNSAAMSSKRGFLRSIDLMARDRISSFSARPVIVLRAETRELLPDLGNARPVPSVGDAHVENWGTWAGRRRAACMGRQRFR